MIVAVEVAEARAPAAPFIGVAHHHRRHRPVALADMVEDRAQLLAAEDSRQVEVHADDAQVAPADIELGDDRAARLDRRQVKRLAPGDLDMRFDQYRIAVPAEIARR